MLEKIGLPAKPSLRGNTWVVDATHCQGCSSQFTFINRKHHCRRCGGIFCNSCTLQRMVLRGQGDSPVRICDPCKKLEEAARFELRHGHRSRAGRGSSRVTSKNEDEVMAQICAGDTEGSSSRSESDANTVSNIEKTRSSASCSNGQEDDNLDSPRETGSATPEDLRQQALYEKKKYKILKGEGKPDEALKAFKRGKELERQADALEIALRKARRKVLPTENVGSLESGGRNKPHASNDKDKDDLLSELKELGWSEMDIHNEDRKPTSMTLEGELATLIREIPQEPGSSKKKQVIDKNQVTAHKRKALMLKRGGKLAEAKEELKKAKVLEKQIEEEELLAGGEDSDDELSALIQGMDDDKHDNFAMEKDHNFHLDDLTGVTDSLVAESNFEVTEEDMQDPEIAAALKSFGWSEELYNHETSAQVFSSGRGVPSNAISSKEEGFGEKPNGNVSGLVEEPFATQRPSSALDGSSRRSKAEIQRELLGIKRKALALRREGKNEEAEEVLKTAKLLEAQIAEMEAPKNTFKAEHAKLKRDKIETSIGSTLEGEDEVDITENDLHDPSLLSMLQDLGWKDEVPESVMVEALPSRQVVKASAIESSSGVSSSAPRTKAKIQRELLGLKRKALDLRRKGNMEEAEETLRMTKVLEAEIEELEEPKKTQVDASEVVNGLSTSMRHESHENLANSVEVNKSTQEAVSADVGPMSLERTAHGRTDASQEKSAKPYRSTEHYSGTENKAHRHMAAFGAASASKPGNSSNSIDLMDFLISNDRSSRQSAESLDDKPYSIAQSSVCIPSVQPGPLRVSDEDSRIKGEALIERKEMHENKRLLVAQTSAVQEPVHQKSQGSRQDEILSHKKKALALKREGKLAEAKEELKQAKLLEKSLGEDNTHPTSSKPSSNILPEETKGQDLSKVNRKPLSGRERFKIQQESLSHKRQALKLRKEGKVKEAEIELDLAKSLEAQLEESNPHASGNSSEDGVDDVVVEDVLDPELLSALRAIGVVDAGAVSRGPKISEPVNHNAESRDNASQEKLHLQEQIKAEKVRALNLKRAGKQAEALDAFRHAKLLEKKLNAL